MSYLRDLISFEKYFLQILFQQLKITNLYPESQILEREVNEFLTEWRNNDTFIYANTSGSTGVPKKVRLDKKKLAASAKMTGEYFQLSKGQKALLVLSPKFIAGKMMVLRALLHDMELVLGRLSSKPLDELILDIDFCAMIPTQVQELLDNDVTFHSIKHLIIGGAQISSSLKERLLKVPTRCYATFGMTETLSHIALAEINESDFVYKPLPGVDISIGKESVLTISAPNLLSKKIETTDVVAFHEGGGFIWKGRSDFVINSGGVKLHPELIEKKLAPFLDIPFFISSEKDKKFGEVVVLFIESSTEVDLMEIINVLDKYERPKKVYYRDTFVYTETGKLNRLRSIE